MLRRLGRDDLDRLRHLRGLLGAPHAHLVLASATGFERGIVHRDDVTRITPADVYPDETSEAAVRGERDAR